MTNAMIFPGQGSQSVGMGKEFAEAFPEARAVFDEVDDALGEKLSDVIWDGPDGDLALTRNAQPALMVVSIAVLKVMEARGVNLSDHVAYVAGHSLGEYTALTAAGGIGVSLHRGFIGFPLGFGVAAFAVVEEVQLAISNFVRFWIDRNKFAFGNSNGTKATILGYVFFRIFVK